MAMKRWALLLLLFACASGCGEDTAGPDAAQQPEQPPPAKPDTDQSSHAYRRPTGNLEASRRLGIDVPLKAGDTTLVALAERLKREAGLEVKFDWQGLEEVGITPTSSIQVKAGTASAERVLSMALYLLTPDAGPVYPTYMIVDGVVVVGTNASLVQQLPQVNWPTRGKPGTPEGESDAVNHKLNAVVKLPGDNLSLEQVFSAITQATGLGFDVGWRNLEIVGIDRDTLVMMNLPSLSARQLLDAAIRQVSTDAFDDDKAGYTVRDGVIVVTTLRELDKHTETRVYDVRDLVERPYGPALRQVYKDDPFALELLDRYDLIWTAKAQAQNPSTPPTPAEIAQLGRLAAGVRQRLLEELTDLIPQAIGSQDRWLDEQWTIRELNGNLLIKTSTQGHDEIDGLLDRLREGQRGTMLRFMREAEAARLMRDAEEHRRRGALREALASVRRANQADPGNEAARAMRAVIEKEAGVVQADH